MNFSEFNETIKSQLNNLTSHNRLPHAIIITGGNEELRNSVTDYLCVYAVCSEENKPCYNCKNCKKAMSHIHPDISYVQGSTKSKNLIYNKIRLKCEKVCRKGDAICFHQIYIVMWMY